MKVLVGKGAQTADSLTTILADHPSIGNTEYENNALFYIAPTTGVYYFGFQCYSPADQWNLDLDDINISLPAEVDYAAIALTQTWGVPVENTTRHQMSKQNPTGQFEMNFKGSGKPSSDVNNSKTFVSNQLTTDLAGLLPVYFNTTVKRLGNTGPDYTIFASFNGTNAAPMTMPGIGVIGGVQDVPSMFTPSERGTFTAISFVNTTGDGNTSNDTVVNHKIRVYPDSAIVLKNDDYENNALTSVGFGTNNLPLTAGVRFTADRNMRLANVDAIYRNETTPDSIEVKVWAAGIDTLAPGAVLYSKKFAGINYINAGAAIQLVTLPLGDDAPNFVAGSDFWVSITVLRNNSVPYGLHMMEQYLNQVEASFHPMAELFGSH